MRSVFNHRRLRASALSSRSGSRTFPSKNNAEPPRLAFPKFLIQRVYRLSAYTRAHTLLACSLIPPPSLSLFHSRWLSPVRALSYKSSINSQKRPTGERTSFKIDRQKVSDRYCCCCCQPRAAPASLSPPSLKRNYFSRERALGYCSRLRA